MPSQHGALHGMHRFSSNITHPPGGGVGYLIRQGALYIGPTLDTATHVAHAYKIYIALHGSFDLLLGDRTRLTSLRSVVIAPDRPHRLVSQTAAVALLFVLPETPEGRSIAGHHSRRDTFAVPPELIRALAPVLKRFWERGGAQQAAPELSDLICRSLAPGQGRVAAYDHRIERALAHLKARKQHHTTISEAAAVAAMSPSRFRHLFNEQVGIPFSRYLLWARLHTALEAMPVYDSLTEVAHEAGFADQSHFCRTFRRMLGITPSAVFKNVSLQVSEPGAAGDSAHDEQLKISLPATAPALGEALMRRPE